MCDDRGMTATDQIAYFVTCWDNPRGTKIPGTLTSFRVRNHLANCPHDHDVTLPDDLRDAIEAADRALDCEFFLENLLREGYSPHIEAAWRTARAGADAAMSRVAELKRRHGIPT
jgi:hypothetical protein